MTTTITFEVNHQSTTIETEGDRPLLEVLREDLGLTGTKYGCGEGECRSCVALIDGRPVTTCEYPVSKVAGKTIQTIEGLAVSEDRLHPVQEAFIEESAMQCGYCVPGMMLTAVALLRTNASPTEAEIREWLDGNVCRCCNYPYIVNAIQRAATMMPEGA